MSALIPASRMTVEKQSFILSTRNGVVEIISKDDRYLDLMQKLEEYREWGVRHIWVIDPSTQRFSMYTELGLQNVSSLGLSDYPFHLTPAELFANL